MSESNKESVVEERMQRLIDQRMSKVRALARSEAEVEQAKKTLQQAHADHRKAWSQAVSAGWTEQELRKAQLTKPAPKRKRQTASAPTQRSEPKPDPIPEQHPSQSVE